MVRALAFAFVTLSCAGIVLGLAAAVGCVTSAPPDLIQPAVTRPTILHDAVQPPPGTVLTELPTQFIVPVQVSSASPTFYYTVFVDYDACDALNGCQPTGPDTYPTIVPPAPGTEDGGVAVVGFELVTKPDPSLAHRIDFLVGHSFSVQAPHTWDSVGGDIVTWTYNPGGSASGFPLYDAGALQDGAFPPADAPSDGVLITPESGAGRSVSVRARGAALAVAVAAACNPLGDGGGTGSSVSSPLNACPAHPCGNYVQSGVTPSCECPGTTCTVGECLVSSTYTGLVVVVSLSADSFYAPGQTFAIPEEDLFKPKATDSCAPPMCAHLPALGIVQGAYLVDPATQVTLGWNLGNAGHNTALPIHVTYRPLWQPGGSGTAAVDATSIGLPLPVVDGYVVVESGVGSQPGPGGGLSIGFQANVQPGLYEATFQPDPPFDGAFPPDVKPATIAAGNTIDDDALVYDVTTKVTGGVTGPIVPTFSLTRSGGLVGWTAYLRDQTTKRRVSTLAALGTKTSAVQLATNHEPPSVDALTNAELAVVPPAGSMVPTFVVGLVGGELPSLEPLPDLPDLTTVTGVVTDADGVTPVEADLVFEVHAGASTANGIEVLGPPAVLNPTNFDYTARASATLSPDGSTASYSVDLPPGQYQLTLRPRDGAHAVTVQSAFPVPIADTAIESDLLAGATQAVTGRALLGDGRLLSGALVQVLPTACSLGTGDDCLPRPASTMTGDDGSWALALDPGTYALQLQPAPGSRFPWVTQALLIGPTPVTVPPVVVPVPVSSTLAFHDPYDNPSVSALVRVFQVPPTGPAVEMARAITDATGQAELYLAPSKP